MGRPKGEDKGKNIIVKSSKNKENKFQHRRSQLNSMKMSLLYILQKRRANALEAHLKTMRGRQKFKKQVLFVPQKKKQTLIEEGKKAKLDFIMFRKEQVLLSQKEFENMYKICNMRRVYPCTLTIFIDKIIELYYG